MVSAHKQGAVFVDKFAVLAGDPDGPLGYAATGLPEGVTIDAATGEISGASQAVGEHRITVTVTDAIGAALRGGLRDFRRAPQYGLFFSLIYVLAEDAKHKIYIAGETGQFIGQ